LDKYTRLKNPLKKGGRVAEWVSTLAIFTNRPSNEKAAAAKDIVIVLSFLLF
jgi:hypothetical protein